MDTAEIILRAVGAFYAFAGYAGTRAGLVSHLLDVALAGITLKKPPRAEMLRTGWLLIASTIVLAGGLALMLLLDWAAWIFLVSAAAQLAYLALAAPLYFDREDPPDAKGRQQTANAFILYAAATGAVAWGYGSGKLQSWTEVHPLALAFGATALIAHVAYLARSLVMPRRPAFGGSDDTYEPAPELPPERLAQSKRVQVMAEFECHPLWALDDGLNGNFPPELLGLSAELTRDLNDWAAAYQSIFDPGDPTHTPWTQEQRKEHDEMGRRLAERVASERPDLSVCIMDDTGFVDIPPPSGLRSG